jgi:hypothetical protein
MTEDDKRCLIAALRAVEALCFRNMALETILEKFNVRNWKALADALAAEPTVHVHLRERFRQTLEELEREPPDKLDAQRIQELLLRIPPQGKPN